VGYEEFLQQKANDRLYINDAITNRKWLCQLQNFDARVDAEYPQLIWGTRRTPTFACLAAR
jgi:hypothetical protein